MEACRYVSIMVRGDHNSNQGQIFATSDLEQSIYNAAGLTFLPPLLTEDYTARRSTGKAAITEILAAELGDSISKSPHLIVRVPSISYIRD
jgi:cleavage and polyadenylation specificity factor subunit 1